MQIAVMGREKENLQRGLITEYNHNSEFTKAGWHYETTRTTNPYDRIFGGNYQDDKISLWYKDEDDEWALSGTHTISEQELFFWQQKVREGRRVIIHSFIEPKPNSLDSKYMCSLDFAVIDANDRIIQKAGRRPVFYRKWAYQHARVC